MSNITHAEEEKKLSAKTEQFLGYLMRSGYLADPKIQDPKARAKKKEKNQKTYHNTRMLLEHYREMLWANIDPDLYKAFARAILPDLREFVADPQKSGNN